MKIKNYFCHFYPVPEWRAGESGGCGTVLEFKLFY